ncbi:MAG: hypothetical protein IJ011_07145 [Clostridia bacterium]|nr:hypothetical protein [Clostridia bacterium]
MKNKRLVKRVISMVLMLAMLGTVVTVFSGCGLFTKKVVGTEAAKILLARERLDEDTIGQPVDIISMASDDEDDGGFFSNLFSWAKIGSSSVLGNLKPIAPVLAKIAPGAEVAGNSVYWSEFGDASDLKANYAQFIQPIDDMAAETAELIAEIKEDVGITDKWISSMDTKHMLIVDENSETIIEYYEPYDSVHVSTRYTTDDAKCVYEMYSFLPEGGSTSKIRNKCIPGEYYEYCFQYPDGTHDYFIADKSSGEWIMNRFSIHDEAGVGFDLAAVKGNIGYGAYVSATNTNGVLTSSSDGLFVSMFSPYEERDIAEIRHNGEEYEISIFMSNVESGIKNLFVDGNSFTTEDYGDAGTVYLHGNGEENTRNVAIQLSNRQYISAGNGNDKVKYTGARINYNAFFGEETYIGRLNFTVKSDDATEAYSLLSDYLSSNGVKLKADASDVAEAYAHSKLLHDNFDVMSWNGYRMSSVSNIRAAESILNADFDKYYSLYLDVKDNESISGFYDVAKSVTFGKMELISSGNAKYADGSINVAGLKAKTNATDLLEEGKKYTLKVGLALRDSDGNISSVNTVSLASENETSVTYTGGTLELSQTAEYVVPTALSEGEYIVVVYFATADEGIRVTEMFPLAFFSAEEGKLDSAVMDVTVKKSGENLFIDYDVKLSDTVEADYVKSSYTYDEIKTILIRGILAKGYPKSDAVVQTGTGNNLSETGTYGAGTYRLKYLVNTSEGLVEAYMYCTLSAN